MSASASASSILPPTLALPRTADRRFSSLTLLTAASSQLQFHRLSISASPHLLRCPPIRMGGGPRTFPGGVSKWQWKRMQSKKAKQLLKARLLRERQIYEMRKRTELKAAVSELERPWEVVERAPKLFSVSADEQLKALADRFQRPGGFDMWSERDGPQVFGSADGLPSARFFPKGAVHSVRPYGDPAGGEEELRFEDWIARGGGGTRRRRSRRRDTVVDVEARDSIEGSGDTPGEDHLGTRTGGSSGNWRFHGSSEKRQQRLNLKDGSPSRSNSVAIANGREKSGKIAGRGDRRINTGRVSLRPTTDLYTEEGGYRTRDSKWSGGNLSRKNS